jgi:hypothetical protein
LLCSFHSLILNYPWSWIHRRQGGGFEFTTFHFSFINLSCNPVDYLNKFLGFLTRWKYINIFSNVVSLPGSLLSNLNIYVTVIIPNIIDHFLINWYRQTVVFQQLLSWITTLSFGASK